MSAPAQRAPSMPRLAENAREFMDSLALACRCGVLIQNHGVVYPTVRAYGLADFSMDLSGEFSVLADDGMTAVGPSPQQRAQIDAAIEADQVSVLLLSRPGYGSGYGARKTLKVIHQPRGRWDSAEMPLSLSAS